MTDVPGPDAELDALRAVPLLRVLDDDALRELAALIDRRPLPGGALLFEAGDDPDALYVVATGRLSIVDTDGVVMRQFAAGEPIGELGVISGEPRSARARAERDSSVWVVPRAAFEDLLATHPDVQRSLLTELAARVRASRPTAGIAPPRVVTVTGDDERDACSTVRDLAAALGRLGSTYVLAPLDHSPAGATREELTHRLGPVLDAAEAAHRWVIIDGSRDPAGDEGGYALSQADRVVLTATSARPDRIPPLPTGRPVDLLVGSGADAAAWTAAVDPVSHNPRTPDGVDRVARRLGGRSTGLALAGGGVRGLAHLGVYAELREAGVAIDRFGGTSVGALAAALFSLDWDVEASFEAAREFIQRGRVLSDYTLPAVSLVRAQRVERAIKGFLGDTLVEQLPKDFFAVSADLVTGAQVVHRRGSAWRAVRASISIPGFMPPVIDGDAILVDGGVINNLPADVMDCGTDGRAICVDLRGTYQPSTRFGLFPLVPPAPIRQLVTGTGEKLPAFPETLLRTVDLASSGRMTAATWGSSSGAWPDVSGISFLNFGGFDAAVEAGRAAARDALETKPELLEL